MKAFYNSINMSDKILSSVERGMAVFSGYLILLMAAAGVYAVISRRVFDTPVSGLIDVFSVAMVVVAYAGVALSEAAKAQLRMSLITNMFSGTRLEHAFEIFACAVGIFVVCMISLSALLYAKDLYEFGGATNQVRIPLWGFGLFASISLMLLCLRLILKIIVSSDLLIHNDKSRFDFTDFSE